MNAYCIILRFDGQPISQEELSAVSFKTPKWNPDYQENLIDGAIGFSCTQRYITPECHTTKMPYRHSASGCIIAADAFLTDREILILKLGLEPTLSDCELILQAFLKWGQECTTHLRGRFFFAIWNPKNQTLFLATDQLGQRSCYYAYKEEKYFICSNYIYPFRKLCPALKIEETFFCHIALDSSPLTETCYSDIHKLPPAHCYTVRANHLQKRCYWQLKDKQRLLPYSSREDYYQAFRSLFEERTKNYLRSIYPITAHISGGLDSSSVAAMAAKILLEKNQTLYGFTAIPNQLEGASYRPGWQYHELDRVQALLEQFPNIKHLAYKNSPDTDVFDLIKDLYPYIEKPYRNIFNMEWMVASLSYASANNSRIVLNAGMGNLTVSWRGQTFRSKINAIYRKIFSTFNPNKMFSGYFRNHNSELLQNSLAKQILLERQAESFKHHRDLLTAPRATTNWHTQRIFSLWSGVELLDPTGDLSIVEFCYNTPQWVFMKGRKVLQRRLLVREALHDILPEEIRNNPNRGEQSADWFLSYARHRNKWRERLAASKSKLIWKLYDRPKMLELFQPVDKTNSDTTRDISNNLMRCLALNDFLEFVEGVE